MKLSKKDINELFKIAEANKLKSDIELDEIDNFSKVQRFILIFKIKDGKNPVPSKMMYHLYKSWSEDPIPRQAFLLELTKFFEKHTHKNKVCYYLNNKTMTLVKKLETLKDQRKAND